MEGDNNGGILLGNYRFELRGIFMMGRDVNERPFFMGFAHTSYISSPGENSH